MVRLRKLSHRHERRCRSGPPSAPHQTALESEAEKIWHCCGSGLWSAWDVQGATRPPALADGLQVCVPSPAPASCPASRHSEQRTQDRESNHRTDCPPRRIILRVRHSKKQPYRMCHPWGWPDGRGGTTILLRAPPSATPTSTLCEPPSRLCPAVNPAWWF